MIEKKNELNDILDKFEYKIKKSLKNTNYQEREDLEQEIKLKIMEKISSVKFNKPPSFWSFFSD